MRAYIYTLLFILLLVHKFAVAQVTAGEKGQSLHFNGVNNHIAISNNAKIAIDSGTIEVWIKSNDTTKRQWQSVVSKTLAYQLTLYYQNTAAYDWREKKVFTIPLKINDNQWHHLAFVFRKNVTNGSQLFLDGQIIGPPFTYGFLYNGSELHIGGNNYEPQYFQGYIDEFRLWNIPRSVNDIQENYAHELKGTEKGLVVYYKFNDGIPNANNFNTIYVQDETSNNLDGKLVGFTLKDSLSNFVADSPVKTVNTNPVFKYVRKNKLEIVLIVVSLLTIISLFYFRNRFLQKRNQLLNRLVQQRTTELQQTLSQKDILIQEVHHRVKNNLQIISSMLQLEADNNRTPEQQLPLMETSRRLYSMALVHEQLYRIDNLEKINLKKYIQSLADTLGTMYDSNERQINFNINVPFIEINITKCISLGLIISEMLSNAMKHAFYNMPIGTIFIELTKLENGLVQLIIKDNGIGISNEKLMHMNNNLQNKTLGIRLVEVFSRQLNGKLQFLTDKGFGIQLLFNIAE